MRMETLTLERGRYMRCWPRRWRVMATSTSTWWVMVCLLLLLSLGDAVGRKRGTSTSERERQRCQSNHTAPSVVYTTTCAVEQDPNLKPMYYNVGNGKEEFLAYVTPDVSTFYRSDEDDFDFDVDDNDGDGNGNGDRDGVEGSRKLHESRDYDDLEVDDGPIRCVHVKKTPRHTGLAGKFINLSPERLHLYWNAGPYKKDLLIAVVEPFQSTGTGTFEGHEFYFARMDRPDVALITFRVSLQHSLYVYDAFDEKTIRQPHLGGGSRPQGSTYADLDVLRPEEYRLYREQKVNLLFGKQYRQVTKRDWLSFYRRRRPVHGMWPAEYFDQRHTVLSNETHFVLNPPRHELGKITAVGSARKIPQDEPRILQAYRSVRRSQAFHLRVLSVSPRIFEIDNFLSPVEVEHLLTLASLNGLSRSTTTGGAAGDTPAETRTSSNTWIYREASPIVDAIYRRVADLLGIDEALLRYRDEHEVAALQQAHQQHTNDNNGNSGAIDGNGNGNGNGKGGGGQSPSPSSLGAVIRSQHSIAEALQVVHYRVGQEYTAHHDFGYAKVAPPPPEDHVENNDDGVNRWPLPARFATMLLYLNEGMSGGETAFPKYVNAETSGPLRIVPKIGKAILFYSFLPDGNHDDFSQHAAMPVLEGEKWLANLWIWDPIYPKPDQL